MYIYSYIIYKVLYMYVCVCVCVCVYIYTYMKYMRERGFLEGTGSHSYRSYKVQNLQCELAGWIPREEPILWFKTKDCCF